MIYESWMASLEEGKQKYVDAQRYNAETLEAADAAFAALPLAGMTRECPKCRFGMLTYRYTTCYWPFGAWRTRNPLAQHLLMVVPSRELIVRNCPQCGANTFERPADSVDDYEETA
ncbi:hypothetical protein ACFWU5_16695 [Nocardia sp. NPDC058640]|uniref:hypothetical protein n=1 Tax=Nocardia sp. NPDC058640 TaxID=3346571 RepID=UPI0036517301